MIVRHRYPATARDHSLDRMFEQLTGSFFDSRRPADPMVDGAWTDDEYVLTIDLPGIPADAVSVELTGSTLTISAPTNTTEWQRSLKLGGRLDPDKVRAQHLDGRLTVRIGTFDKPEPRRIVIDTAPATDVIDAAADEAQADDQSNEANSTG